MRAKDFDFEEQLDLCACLHLDTGHELLKGKCAYDDCSCLFFVPCEIELEVLIEIDENEVEYKGGIF